MSVLPSRVDDPVIRKRIEALSKMPMDHVTDLLCKSSLGVWTERKRRLEMSPLHWEWCRLRMKGKRLAIVAFNASRIKGHRPSSQTCCC